MKEFKFLRFLDYLSFFYEKLGIDYDLMRKILQVKLTIDQRRKPTMMIKDTVKESENMFKKSLLMYALMGFVIMFFIFPDFSLFMKMNMIYAMLVFMVMMIMISDYSSLLLDIKEKNILLSKPIDSKTINAAKITHILAHLITITMVIAAPTLVAGSIKYGLGFGGIFLFQLCIIPGLIILFTSLLYFLILSFFDGEKLKDIINYFQIILAIFMIVVYQLIGNIFQVFQYDIVFIPKWWSYFIPSTWFAAPFSLFLEGHYEAYYVHFTFLGIIAPIVTLVLYFKRVAPYFEKKLQKLNTNGTKRNESIEKKKKLHKKIAALFCWHPIENTFFRFTQNILSNERNLKLKLYPNLAFAAILPLLFVVRSFAHLTSFGEITVALSGGRYYLAIYFTITLLATSIPMLSTSEGYGAAWIYKILPIENPSVVYKGALKGFVVKLMLPVYLLLSLIFLFFYGFVILMDITLMFLNMILSIVLIFYFFDNKLPFSQDFEYVKHNSIITMFAVGIFSGLAAYVHNFMISKNITLIPYMIFILAAIAFLWKKGLKSTLQKPKS
ncbi:hypothetical protein CACET_c11730 [Clostridium aceticum]|uniref:Uncharacterized protein n=1 Tax=Clostridium aceticum TaxID=84022 RepID=A0A0D8I8U0_9CLOT|nr:hypothetical protein [Clostridium aceticum]AKL94638.1 hypothetical protein CACET_c11730 [Clostridium aceticum]KJF26464.1 hypothetical protein TZ02_13105 [Clostridium aceticum]